MKSRFWDTTAMNKLEVMERLKLDRKLLKPQVERRRRERMNRSLENLRILLLHSPEQQRRVEKAEILEHTVLFLQSSIAETKKFRPEDESPSEGHQFLDGFSACLQKAAKFLQDVSKAQGLQDSLSSSLFQCLRCPHRPRVRDVRHSHFTHGLQCVRGHAHTLSHPYRIPLRHTDPNNVQRLHNQNTASSSRSTTSSQMASQCVWRPWP